MIEEGYSIGVTDNDVWYVESVPTKCIIGKAVIKTVKYQIYHIKKMEIPIFYCTTMT